MANSYNPGSLCALARDLAALRNPSNTLRSSDVTRATASMMPGKSRPVFVAASLNDHRPVTYSLTAKDNNSSRAFFFAISVRHEVCVLFFNRLNFRRRVCSSGFNRIDSVTVFSDFCFFIPNYQRLLPASFHEIYDAFAMKAKSFLNLKRYILRLTSPL